MEQPVNRASSPVYALDEMGHPGDREIRMRPIPSPSTARPHQQEASDV